MKDKLVVDTRIDERTPEEAAKAAPVSLPAGAYDGDKLADRLDDAAKAKNGKRDELVGKALDDSTARIFEEPTLGLTPGHVRVDVENKDLGVTESRVVFDPKLADAAEAADKAAQPAIQPAADKPAADAPSSGEK
jgi:hypothetical protein